MGPADSGGTAYEALHDPELTKILLRAMADQATIGRLRFATEPGAVIDASLDSLMLTGEQSNTSLIFGDSAILKVMRRVFPGRSPELEVTSALARRGSKHVAEPFGWIEMTIGGGEPALLAILSRYLPGASDGWSLAATSLRDLYSGDGAADPGTIRPDQAGGDFAGEAFRLGRATAEVHADLAAVFGVAELPRGALRDLGGQMARRLEVAEAEVPELHPYAGKLRGYYADLAATGGRVPVQRVHGDYHLGQVLRTATGWVVLDFEGEPTSGGLPRSRCAMWPACSARSTTLPGISYLIARTPGSSETSPTSGWSAARRRSVRATPRLAAWIRRSTARCCGP
jgi:maltokinase